MAGPDSPEQSTAQNVCVAVCQSSMVAPSIQAVRRHMHTLLSSHQGTARTGKPEQHCGGGSPLSSSTPSCARRQAQRAGPLLAWLAPMLLFLLLVPMIETVHKERVAALDSPEQKWWQSKHSSEQSLDIQLREQAGSEGRAPAGLAGEPVRG